MATRKLRSPVWIVKYRNHVDSSWNFARRFKSLDAANTFANREARRNKAHFNSQDGFIGVYLSRPKRRR